MMVGEGIGKPVDGRSVVSRSGQTQGLRPSRISANWVPEQKMVELITNGNRFAWRVCNECAKFDRLKMSPGIPMRFSRGMKGGGLVAIALGIR